MVSAAFESQAVPDAEAVIARFWPYDAPPSPELVTAALDAVDELVHYGCNATRRRAGVGSAPHLYRLLAGLLDAADRLPQLLDQLAGHTRAWGAGDDIRHDRHRGHPANSVAAGEVAAEEAADQLVAAARDTRRVAERIGYARRELSHLYHADGGEQG